LLVSICDIEAKPEPDNLEDSAVFLTTNMTNGNFLLCSLLAVAIGFMAQQSVETLINTSLTLLPFNIKTVA
jgi:hypothetical protein